jgi:hypothetical protein
MVWRCVRSVAPDVCTPLDPQELGFGGRHQPLHPVRPQIPQPNNGPSMQRIAVSVLAAACLLAAASPAAAFGLGSWVTARATYVRPSYLDRRLTLTPACLLHLLALPVGLIRMHAPSDVTPCACDMVLIVYHYYVPQYGRDAWPLHTGSCEYGFICPNRFVTMLCSASLTASAQHGRYMHDSWCCVGPVAGAYMVLGALPASPSCCWHRHEWYATLKCRYYICCRWSDELAEGYDVTAVSDKSDLYGHCGCATAADP